MAFDQSTRNRLNRFVADSRGLLATEFTRQLQATYGMNPVTGEVANINSLAGLTPHQQETAQLLRDTFEHYLAANDHSKSKSKEKENRLAALDRIVREQAFTVLNRLAALRMSEARGFLTESLAYGYDSKGFQLFHRIAGISLGETGEAYTHYLFSIFDEFTLDLSVLFDRFAAQGRLFPSTPVLLELLALINNDEVAPLWAEDETIGWIYQYFNSQEERKKMRDASQAPRNSRELAVRNQFFTPRYVVEFLTDNTLGRIWYEMTKGQTKLADECEYLVKRPNEIFLTDGAQAPEHEATEGLSQEELLKQTVYIEHRALKDPRDIKMLDPACGSMHFGLYCFDLFERIYDEAWDIEAAQGQNVFIRENRQPSLTQSYNNKAEFLTHVPRLIIEHNIHGVDIDPRAAQVAGMSLWQRAHNSWQQAGIKPQLRPQITKSNIVCAEPMPGEKELLQEFASQLKPTVLGQLVEVIFEKMQLAGEAGTLLKIEKEIEDAIAGAKAIWQQQNQALSQFPDLAKVAKQRGDVDFDVSDIDDEGFWQQAEQKILDALAQYASSTSSDMTAQKRLFASDAAKGFAFIDLCKKRFDVVLMNPPFGSPSMRSLDYLKESYSDNYTEIYLSFFIRALTITPNGLVGAITSRTWMNLAKQFVNFRKKLINEKLVDFVVELGAGVLDNATVETSVAILSNKKIKTDSITFFCPSVEPKKTLSANLLTQVNSINNSRLEAGIALHSFDYFKDKPSYAFIHEADSSTFSKVKKLDKNISNLYIAKQGMGTSDDMRFVRLIWELPTGKKYRDEWPPICLGDQDSKYYAEHFGRVNWKGDAHEMKTAITKKFGSHSRTMLNMRDYFKSGLTYQYTGQSFRVHPMRLGSVFSMSGQSIHPSNDSHKYSLLSLLNSELSTTLLKDINPGRFFQSGNVNSFPYPVNWDLFSQKLDLLGREILTQYLELASYDERSPFFCINKYNENTRSIVSNYNSTVAKIQRLNIEINAVSNKCFDVENELSGSLKLESTTEGKVFSKKVSVAFRALFATNENNFSVKDPEATFHSLPDVYVSSKNSNEDVIPGLTIIEDLEKSLSDYGNNENLNQGVAKFLDVENLDEFVNKTKYFFDQHLDLYTKNRRAAPIYWPVQTLSGSFTLWLYYPNIDEQTLHKCIMDYIEPELEFVNNDISNLNLNASRSKKEEKELERLVLYKVELEDLINELMRIAKFWSPKQIDGVQINAAPLWRLFQHKKWQKKLKETWEQLQEGEYDWAYLAFSTWPERVLRKCHADRSLSITHDVENDLWHEVEVIKKNKKEPVWEWQPKALSNAELNAYIKEKIATDERLKLYRSNQANNVNGGKL
jgi:hypothetical protein